MTAAVLHDRSGGDRVEDVASVRAPAPVTPSVPATRPNAVHVIAPPQSCWQLRLAESDASGETRLIGGCGRKVVPIDPAERIVSLDRKPYGFWDLGMRIVVNGAVVRDVRPAPYGGLRVNWADRLPEKTIVARLIAPEDGCWTATIEDEIEDGCGSRDLSLDVRGEVLVAFERNPPAAWPWCLNLELDGRVVQTFGPDSNPSYPLAFWYAPPEPGYGEDGEVEPVDC